MTDGIELQNDAGYALDAERLRHAAQTTLQQQNAPSGASLTIVITDDEAVAALNRQFRGIDAPTDVLSFPAGQMPVYAANSATYLGDLVIAYPYAVAQAQRERHDRDESLALLVVHGALHLLGFDHDTPDQRAVMWAAQAAVLEVLGISPEIVPALEQAGGDHGEA